MSSTPVTLGPIAATRALSVLATLVAQGPIVRRPAVTAWAERRQEDRRIFRELTDLRRLTGGGPAVVRVPGRTLASVLDPDDVVRVLDDTPDPFRADTREKRAALRKFQPDAVLVTPPGERGPRRAANVAALQPHHVEHDHGARFDALVDDAVDRLARRAHQTRRLDWATLQDAFDAAARGVVLGGAATGDTALTDRLTSLRAAGNWAYLTPDRPHERADLTARLAAHVGAAPEDSLAGQLHRRAPGVDPTGQVPHWLFAFDAAAIAVIRALAVAVGRPQLRERLVAEADRPARERLTARGTVLESVRLWPTTLVVLRESTRETVWGERTLPAGTSLVIVSSFFHRDAARVPFADDLVPEVWDDGRAEADRALVPFSTGPAGCPGRDVVAAVAGRFLARTLARLDLRLDRARHLARAPLPWTIDHAGLVLEAR